MKTSLSEKALRLFPFYLIFYEMVCYLANDAYLPAMPELAKDLGVNNDIVQLTLTAFFLGNASMQILLGPIADRYGRRTLLLGGGIVFVASTFYCTFSNDVYWFLVARFLQGAAVTSMIISGYATVHAMYDQTRAIKTLSWMASITVLAPALGPLFGALILYVGDWRIIFAILGVLGSISLMILLKKMPETLEKPIPIVFSTVLKSYAHLIMRPAFIRPVIAISILFATMVAWVAAGPFLVMDTFHYSPFVFGLMQAVVFTAFILGTRFINHFIERVSLIKLIRISLLLAFVGGLGSLIMCHLFKDYLVDILLPMIVIAFASGIGFPIFNRISIEGCAQPMGLTMAVFSTFMGLSGFLGSLLISSFFSGEVHEFGNIIFILTLVAAVLYIKK